MQTVTDPSNATKWRNLIEIDRVSSGEMLALIVDDLRLAAFHIGDQFYVTSNVCTHQFALLTDGWLDECIIECPLHGARFDVTSGSALNEIASRNLKTYPTRVRDGILQILL